MVDRSGVALDRVFRALASETRREILRRVADERRTVTELTGYFDMSLAAVSKHMRVLEAAALVTQTKEGRFHWYRLDPGPLERAGASIEELRTFWVTQLGGLERHLGNQAAQRERAPVRRKRNRP